MTALVGPPLSPAATAHHPHLRSRQAEVGLSVEVLVQAGSMLRGMMGWMGSPAVRVRSKPYSELVAMTLKTFIFGRREAE